ncbi:anti-sigma factor domain-containing protein [Amycolatopsis thailandensis]|uniref:anti-sigma factor n=1 Tax=Amycolatopsis thailandensis TaxID=589330 RepID=UPI0036518D76
MTTGDVHTLTGAYALGAVTDLERAAFARHLAACPTCTQEVTEFRETAAILGVAMAAEPGAELRARVRREIASTRQLPPVVPLGDDPPRDRRSRALRIVAAVAATAAVFAGGITVGVAVFHQGSGPVQIAEPVTAPDMVTVRATGTGGGTATVNFSRLRGEAVITAQGLPPLTDGRAYQLWLSGPGGTRSAGLLHTGTGSIAAPLSADIDHVGVTVEPAAGSPHPTTLPVVRVPLGTR